MPSKPAAAILLWLHIASALGCSSKERTFGWNWDVKTRTKNESHFAGDEATIRTRLARSVMACDIKCASPGTTACARFKEELGCTSPDQPWVVNADILVSTGQLDCPDVGEKVVIPVIITSALEGPKYSSTDRFEVIITAEATGPDDDCDNFGALVGAKLAEVLRSDFTAKNIGTDKPWREEELARRSAVAAERTALVEAARARFAGAVKAVEEAFPEQPRTRVEFVPVGERQDVFGLMPRDWYDWDKSESTWIELVARLGVGEHMTFNASFDAGLSCGPECEETVTAEVVYAYEFGRFTGVERAPDDGAVTDAGKADAVKRSRGYGTGTRFQYSHIPPGAPRVVKTVVVSPQEDGLRRAEAPTPGRLVVAEYPDGTTEILLVRARPKGLLYAFCHVVLPQSARDAVPAFEQACLVMEPIGWE